MQTTKEYTHKLLLETARRAFFKKGFKAVSMREISKLSGIGLSNIYNYYPCKDDLLADVLHPLLEAMNSMLEDHNRPEAFSLDVFTSAEDGIVKNLSYFFHLSKTLVSMIIGNNGLKEVQ
mgnify:CR=1 FL=1